MSRILAGTVWLFGLFGVGLELSWWSSFEMGSDGCVLGIGRRDSLRCKEVFVSITLYAQHWLYILMTVRQ